MINGRTIGFKMLYLWRFLFAKSLDDFKLIANYMHFYYFVIFLPAFP